MTEPDGQQADGRSPHPWEPIGLDELQGLMARELEGCAPHRLAAFERVAFAPEKWRQSPWGDAGGGFWAVAADADRVLWYNDIEDGFNVSRFVHRGEIPADGYACNQDTLCQALPRLAYGSGERSGPPPP